MVFRDRRQESWLGQTGLWGFLVLFVIMAFAFHAVFVKMSGFRAPTIPYTVAAAFVGLLICAGFQLKAQPPALPTMLVPGWLPGAFMFLAGIIWLVLYGEIFRKPHFLPVAGNLSLGLALAASFALLLPRWAPADAPDRHRFALVAGGLAANTAFGFVVLSGSALDTYGQIGVVLLVGAGLILLGKKLRTGEA